MTDIPTFKCVIVGDGGVGKTTLVKKHLTGEFEQHYTATLGVDVRPLVFKTSRGPIRLNIWDTAGQEKFSGLKSGYYVQADCAIVMFDLTSRLTYRDSKQWMKEVRDVCGEIPIVYVGSKSDIEPHKVMRSEMEYYPISSKTNDRIVEPFVYLMRQLMHDETLTLGERSSPALAPHIPLLPLGNVN